jgi:hypothetical protein
MQCILYKIYFWKVFHMYYTLICIFICTPICTKFHSHKKWVLQSQTRGTEFHRPSNSVSTSWCSSYSTRSTSRTGTSSVGPSFVISRGIIPCTGAICAGPSFGVSSSTGTFELRIDSSGVPRGTSIRSPTLIAATIGIRCGGYAGHSAN